MTRVQRIDVRSVTVACRSCADATPGARREIAIGPPAPEPYRSYLCLPCRDKLLEQLARDAGYELVRKAETT